MDDARRWRASRRFERVWLWRHQFSRSARGIHSQPAERKWQAIGGRHRDTAESERANASPMMNVDDVSATSSSSPYKAPLRGALVIGAASEAALAERLRAVEKNAKAGRAPAPSAPAENGPARARASGDRLLQCQRTGGQGSQCTESAGGQSAGGLESVARTRHLPRSWSGRRKWRFCIPAKVRSTRTCCNRSEQRSQLWRKLLPKPIA